MAFSDDVKAITQHTFGASTYPSQSDLSSFLKNTVKEIYQRIVTLRPEKQFDFVSEVDYNDQTVQATATSCTAASPAVFTSVGHTLSNDDIVALSDFVGVSPEQLNGITGIVEGVAGNNFQLKGVFASNVLASGKATVLSTTDGLTIENGTVQYVFRYDEHASNKWHSADKISPLLLGYVDDKDSNQYRNAQFPGYIQRGNKIFLYPAPTASSMAKVGVLKFDSALAHDSTGIAYFPDDLEHAVILGASLKTVNALAATATSDGMPSDIVVPSFPEAPTLTTVSYVDFAHHPSVNSAITSVVAPVYTSTWSGLTDFQINTVPPASPSPPNFSYKEIENAAISILSFTSTAPVFDSSAVSDTFTTQMNDDDPEMAALAIQKQSADVQMELNEFQEDNVRYQAELQLKLSELNFLGQKYQKESDQKFQAEMQEFSGNMTKYQNDLSRYQQVIQKEVQEWQLGSLQKYTSQIQDNVAQFNADNSRYQAEIANALELYRNQIQLTLKNSDVIFQQRSQKSLKDMEGVIRNNETLLNEYSARISGWNQRMSSLVGKYSAELQASSTKIQSYTALAKSISEQYLTAILGSQPQPERASR